MSDLGGIMNVMIVVFGIIFKPMSEHMYYTNAIKSLFLARTRDEELLQNPKRD